MKPFLSLCAILVMVTYIFPGTGISAESSDLQSRDQKQIKAEQIAVVSSGGLPDVTFMAQNEDEYYPDDLFEDDLYEDADEYRIADPIYPFNKAMFYLNDKLYFWVLKPVGKGWRAVVPDMARSGIKNFFTNLTMPVRLVNALLQAKTYKAEAEIGRFLVNTTVGVLGFGNPAEKYDELDTDPEDFGQTLGKYGLGHGFYIVWPFLGPSSLRDSFGLAGDRFLDPVTYVDPWEAATGARVTERVNEVSFRIGDYEAFKEAVLVPYEAMRNAYVQRREKSLKQ